MEQSVNQEGERKRRPPFHDPATFAAGREKKLERGGNGGKHDSFFFKDGWSVFALKGKGGRREREIKTAASFKMVFSFCHFFLSSPFLPFRTWGGRRRKRRQRKTNRHIATWPQGESEENNIIFPYFKENKRKCGNWSLFLSRRLCLCWHTRPRGSGEN